MSEFIVGGAEFIRSLGVRSGIPHEAWKRQNQIIVVMSIPKRGPWEVKRAFRFRQRATLTGTCPHCSGAIDPTAMPVMVTPADDGSLVESQFVHHPDCPATDDNLRALLARYRPDSAWWK